LLVFKIAFPSTTENKQKFFQVANLISISKMLYIWI
jgi:hypothetical protein